ncbi:MAG: hypothetical protein KGZ79_00445 [Dethiobacter sp.]|nr:hypothetical protein [Dethiobacter sp.]
MNKKEKLAAFEGINVEVLAGIKKNKEISKLFLRGMTYKEIASQYGLTSNRIGQILDRQARRAIFYKKLLNDQDYQTLVQYYIDKMKRGEPIIIGSEVNDKMNHMMAVNEARLRITAKEGKEVSKPSGKEQQ